jgi:hypothetical protein
VVETFEVTFVSVFGDVSFNVKQKRVFLLAQQPRSQLSAEVLEINLFVFQRLFNLTQNVPQPNQLLLVVLAH